jgi:hypothetical protein
MVGPFCNSSARTQHSSARDRTGTLLLLLQHWVSHSGDRSHFPRWQFPKIATDLLFSVSSALGHVFFPIFELNRTSSLSLTYGALGASPGYQRPPEPLTTNKGHRLCRFTVAPLLQWVPAVATLPCASPLPHRCSHRRLGYTLSTDRPAMSAPPRVTSCRQAWAGWASAVVCCGCFGLARAQAAGLLGFVLWAEFGPIAL